MALRTAGVGAERKLEFWDQYGVEKVNVTYKGVLLPDIDTTPVGDVLLKVLDEKLKLRNAADDADVILDEVFIPHTLTSEFTFTNLVKFARPANEPSVRIGDAGQGYQILQFSKRTVGGGVADLEVEDEASLLLVSAGLATAAWSPNIGLGGIDEGSAYAGCIYFRSAKSLAGGMDYNIERLKFGVGAVADATWAAILQSGLKLKDALDANSQKITNLAACTVGGDGANKTYVDAAVAAAITGLDWQESVLDKDLNTPPGGEVAGDRYIVAAVGAGAWTGHEDEIAEWDGAAWGFATPTEGFCCEVEDENLAYVYDGAAWVLFGSILAFGDDVFATFGGEGRLGWDTIDPNANMMKLDLPAGGVVDVPAFLVGIGIRAVDLAVLDGITEPVMGVIDLDRDARVTIGFSADDQPELNFNAISKLLWDVTDIDANLLKVDLPAGGGVKVPVMALGIAIADVDLGFFDGLTEPVAALVDIAKTSWVSVGFRAADIPELNCGGVAAVIECAPRFVVEKELNLDATTELTIDLAGAIAITKSFHTVDTNADSPTDDLDNITGGAEGDILVLKAEDGARTVVCKHATGNLQLNGSADFSMGHINDSITLIYDGANWIELSRSNNGV